MRARKDIERWLCEAVAAISGQQAADIDPRVEFAAYGVDSASAIVMAGDLERWLGVPVDGTALFEHPSIDRLIVHLMTPPAGR